MDGCIEWTGAKTSKGYGQRKVNGRHKRVHRLAWEEAYGAIPDGLFVLHHCDNRLCHNVDHLFIGTAKDNFYDMRSKGRYKPPPVQSECQRGHDMTIPENIYIRPDGKGRCCGICKTIRSKARSRH